MARLVTELLDAQRLQDMAYSDCVLTYRGYTPQYSAPTAKNRKRIAVMSDVGFPDTFARNEACPRLMGFICQELDRLMINFDDPIIYTGGLVREPASYAHCMIYGWCRYNHYDRFSFSAVSSQYARNQKLCNVCSHLAIFANGWDEYSKMLIQMARQEDLKVKIIPYPEM